MPVLQHCSTNAIEKAATLLGRADLVPPPVGQPFILHPLSAGFPSPAADYAESSLDLNAFLVPRKEASFFFRVAGDSMSGAGIMDGDIVLVDRSVNPQSGHLVLAIIDDEYTLKRLQLVNGRTELHPENSRYQPIVLQEGQVLQIWGVIAAVVRKLHV